MDEKEKVIKVVDKRHFSKDGTRINFSDEEEKKDEIVPPKKDEKKQKGDEPKTDESFLELIMFIVQNALAALGQLKNPFGGKSEVNLEAGGTMIEWLETIEKKTRGNLSPEETKTLKESLYQLKMLFIEARQGRK